MGIIVTPDFTKFPRPKALPSKEIGSAIAHMCDTVAVPYAFGLALAWHESRFNPHAAATHPADLARGGSFGLFQMSVRTAKGLVPGMPLGRDELCDIHLNCELTGDLIEVNRRILLGTPIRYHNEEECIDLAAMHNSGKVFAKAPLSTRYRYVTAVSVAMAEFYELLGK